MGYTVRNTGLQYNAALAVSRITNCVDTPSPQCSGSNPVMFLTVCLKACSGYRCHALHVNQALNAIVETVQDEVWMHRQVLVLNLMATNFSW